MLKTVHLESLWSRRKTMDVLGVSGTTLWREVTGGKLPAIRIGARRLLFDPADVVRYVERCKSRSPNSARSRKVGRHE